VRARQPGADAGAARAADRAARARGGDEHDVQGACQRHDGRRGDRHPPAGPGFEVVVQTSWQPGELREKIRGFHALLFRSATKATAEIIEAADALKVIGRAGIGVDNIDLAAASRKGIVVVNTPTGNTVTTAEHAIAMMMALARKIPQATASMKSGRWRRRSSRASSSSRRPSACSGWATSARSSRGAPPARHEGDRLRPVHRRRARRPARRRARRVGDALRPRGFHQHPRAEERSDEEPAARGELREDEAWRPDRQLRARRRRQRGRPGRGDRQRAGGRRRPRRFREGAARPGQPAARRRRDHPDAAPRRRDDGRPRSTWPSRSPT